MTTETSRPGEKIKKVLEWVKETLDAHPEKSRKDLFKEAEIRFDLTPKDCEFINKNFAGDEDLC